jgi:hypothetical protein
MFSSTTSGLKPDGAFHSIRLICKRSGIRVRAKIGYFASVKGIGDLDPDRQLRMALASDLPFEDVQIRFQSYFFPRCGPQDLSTAATVAMAFRWISSTGGPRLASPLFVVGAMQEAGDGIKDFSDQALPQTMNDRVAPSSNLWEAALYTPPLALSPGDTVVKVAARSTTGELGKGVLRLSVPGPSADRPRVSSLVISAKAESLNTQERLVARNDPWTFEDVHIVPPVSNLFQSSDNLMFYARLVRFDSKASLSASISVKDLSGRTVVGPISDELKESNDASPFGLPVLFTLPASRFVRRKGPFLAIMEFKEGNGRIVGRASASFGVTGEAE